MDFFLEKLDIFNDTNFYFNKELHKYTYNGEVFKSVTQLISSFHVPFDTEAISLKESLKTGEDQEEIKKRWLATNKKSTILGTAVHEWIEDYYNKVWKELPNDLEIIERINKFNTIYAKHLHRLTPLKFELRVFSKKWKIAGTIDALFYKGDKLYILDWKTNGKMTDDDHPDGKWKKLLWPFDSFYDNKVNEYSIQLSIYKNILAEYGIEIADCFIIYIPPQGDARIIKTKDMTEYIEQYFNKN